MDNELNVTVHLRFTLNQTKILSTKCVLLSCANWIALKTHNKIVPTVEHTHTHMDLFSLFTLTHTEVHAQIKRRRRGRRRRRSICVRLCVTHDLIVARQFSNEKTKTDLSMYAALKLEGGTIFFLFFSNEICRNGPKWMRTQTQKWHDVIYLFIVWLVLNGKKRKFAVRQLYNASMQAKSSTTAPKKKWQMKNEKKMPSIDIEEETAKKKSWF